MPFTIDTQITCYLLPGDGPVAEQDFLKNLTDPGETWIIAYAFTLPDMINDLLAAHKKGTPLHIYLDHSQSAGNTEAPLVEQLIEAGVEVTIGTSPRRKPVHLSHQGNRFRRRQRRQAVVLGRLREFFAQCVAAGKYRHGVQLPALAR